MLLLQDVELCSLRWWYVGICKFLGVPNGALNCIYKYGLDTSASLIGQKWYIHSNDARLCGFLALQEHQDHNSSRDKGNCSRCRSHPWLLRASAHV